TAAPDVTLTVMVPRHGWPRMFGTAASSFAQKAGFSATEWTYVCTPARIGMLAPIPGDPVSATTELLCSAASAATATRIRNLRTPSRTGSGIQLSASDTSQYGWWGGASGFAAWYASTQASAAALPLSSHKLSRQWATSTESGPWQPCNQSTVAEGRRPFHNT